MRLKRIREDSACRPRSRTGFERCRGAAVFMKRPVFGASGCKNKKSADRQGFQGCSVAFSRRRLQYQPCARPGLRSKGEGCGKSGSEEGMQYECIAFLAELDVLADKPLEEIQYKYIAILFPAVALSKGRQARTVPPASFPLPAARTKAYPADGREKGTPGIGSQGGDRWLSGRRRRNREDGEGEFGYYKKMCTFAPSFRVRVP